MHPDAYQLGNVDAATAYGLTKEANSAIVPLALAGLGAALAPDGERERAAMLFGLGGLGLQGLFKKPGILPAKPATPSLGDIGKAIIDEGKANIWGKVLNHHVPTPSPRSAPGPVRAAINRLAPLLHGFGKFGSVDFGFSAPLPFTGGVGMSVKGQKERLKGMGQWVPRETIERAFENVDSGVSPEEAALDEADRGELLEPLVGGGAAALAAHRLLPKSGVPGKVLAGLLGAGVGGLHNAAGRDSRAQGMYESMLAAQRERDEFPIRKHPTQTANESTPLAISRAMEDA